MNKTREISDGTFDDFNLNEDLLKGIKQKGYNFSTNIQKKAIPHLLNGRNVIAMAPTGTGKTAAFLVPMLEKLRNHSIHGPRALIISPSRDLALQTIKFTREIGRYMQLTAATILGGSNMEDEFLALHQNPDILVASPARLLHLRVEMGDKLNLSNIEYVVFDEGDRLFESDLSEQLTEILNVLPKSRQTTIFSATLPSKLAEFAKSGIEDPLLVQVESDRKISENLQIHNLLVSEDNKLSVLLELCRNIINDRNQVIVFIATRFHIDYISYIMNKLKIDHVVVYGTLDPEYRKANTAKFLNGKSPIMLVTDIAARGIDIPKLPYIINYHFPSRPKLFVHRVGRVARAGESGTAVNLIDFKEMPYLFDTFLFLNKAVKIVDNSPEIDIQFAGNHGLIGRVPTTIISRQEETLSKVIDSCSESMAKTCRNGMNKYNKTKNAASTQSGLRANNLIKHQEELRVHPLFSYDNNENEKLLEFRRLLDKAPKKTIFELKNNKSAVKAAHHMKKLYNRNLQFKKAVGGDEESFKPNDKMKEKIASSSDNYRVPDINICIDEQLELQSTDFSVASKGATLDFKTDEITGMVRPVGAKRQKMVWNKTRKCFEGVDTTKDPKKIRTESGAIIPMSYKTDKYEKWLKTSNQGNIRINHDENSNDEQEEVKRHGVKRTADGRKKKGGVKILNTFNTYKNPKKFREIKTETERSRRDLNPDQIAKKFREKEKKKTFQKSRIDTKSKKH